jgi:peptide deformylase
MVLDVLTYPDERLKGRSVPVEEITDELRELAGNMVETMIALRGVGLAAPQVGRFIRMLVVTFDRYSDGGKPPQCQVLVNPVIVLGGEEIPSEAEGCLSVPMNFRADVVRRSAVVLDAVDLEGKPVHNELTGQPAIILQHECDHLDGVLFIDRISRMRRALFEGRLRKWKARQDTA